MKIETNKKYFVVIIMSLFTLVTTVSFGQSSYTSNNFSETEKSKVGFKNSTLTSDNSGFKIYVSVLRHNGQTISVKQVERKSDYSEFETMRNWQPIKYKISVNKFSQEETLCLVSEYGWALTHGILTIKIDGIDRVDNIKLPPFLTHSFEIVKLK